MAKKSAKPKQRTKPGVPGEAGNRNRSRRAAKAAGKDETLPGIGHNTGQNGKQERTLSEKERKALLVQHVADYKKLVERLKKVTADIKNFGKMAKAEGGKTQMARIKAYVALETPEGEEAIRAQMADTLEVARWIGSPVGTQFSMDLDEPDRTPAVDRAYTEGETAGMGGEVAKPPYDPTVPQHGEWLSGWHHGNAARIRANIKKKQEQEPPEPEVSEPPVEEAERSAAERKISNEKLAEGEAQAGHER